MKTTKRQKQFNQEITQLLARLQEGEKVFQSWMDKHGVTEEQINKVLGYDPHKDCPKLFARVLDKMYSNLTPVDVLRSIIAEAEPSDS